MDAKRCIGARNYFTTMTDGKGLDDQARGLAVMALEKQIPRKTKDIYSDTACPCCRANFYIEDLNVVMHYYYCPYCGQRLEWE